MIPEPLTMKQRAQASRDRARKKMLKVRPKLKSNQVVHHLDHNPFNNDMTNLYVMENSDHVKHHWEDRKHGIDKYLKDLTDALFMFNERIWIK